MRPVWFSEIEPFPCSVLAHHWPNVPNVGDMAALPALIRTGIAPAPEVLVGGTPCQAFSVAGLRRGLDDERGQLTMTYVGVLNAIDERRGEGDEAVCVWENVPGVLSSKDNAFGCFLAALCGEDEELKPPGKRWANAGCVFGPQRAIAWRVLDAQYFGVAQRRRRVFVVASARTGFDPTSVLFESEGMRRDTPPSREEGAIVAALTSNGVGTCGADDNQGQAGHLIPAEGCWWDGGQVSQTLDAVLHKGQTMPEKNRFPAVLQPCAVIGDITHALNTANNGKGCSEDGTGRGVPTIAFSCKDYGADAKDEQAPTLRAMDSDSSHPNAGGRVAVAYGFQPRIGRNGRGDMGDVCAALNAQSGQGNAAPCAVVRTAQTPSNGWGINTDETAYALDGAQGQAVQQHLAVRRLTPVECERLQGFPDGHTDVPHRGKPAADGPRYKAIGNSKAIPVVNWLGKRLLKCLINC